MTGIEYLRYTLTEEEFEQLDNTLHNYRAWPATDLKGTVERFEEVLELVGDLISARLTN